MLAFAGSLSAQGPVAQSQSVSRTIAMTVVDGTLLQIALDKEVRVRKVGEPIAGRVMQPVYVFDRLVIPVGAVAVGRISVIEPVSARRRTLDALNAEFTPYHKLAVLSTDSSSRMAVISIYTRLLFQDLEKSSGL
jgi:hypothetical protein